MSRGLQASGVTPIMIFGGMLAVVFGFLVSTPISYGINYVNLKLVRGEKFDVTDVFMGFKENYLNMVLSALLTNGNYYDWICFINNPGNHFCLQTGICPLSCNG